MKLGTEKWFRFLLITVWGDRSISHAEYRSTLFHDSNISGDTSRIMSLAECLKSGQLHSKMGRKFGNGYSENSGIRARLG